MNEGKKYQDGDVQVSVFPMEVCNITQGILSGISHKGRYAWDLGGKDKYIDVMYAPFDCVVVWKKPNGSKTGIVVTNTRKVLTPSGTFEANRINILLWHDNDTSDLWVNKFIPQGQKLYDEGKADKATGNHIHLMVGVGKYDGKYPLYQTIFGNWAIKNQVDPIGIFFGNDTIMKNGRGYAWKYWTEIKQVDDLKSIDHSTLKKGDIVKVIGTHWATGSKIPLWVKLKQYEIIQLNEKSALLKGVNSWVNLNDLKKV